MLQGMGFTALVADEQRILVGTGGSEALVLDPRGKVAFRKSLKPSRAITWIHGVPGLILASDGAALIALDARLNELWRDSTNGAPAAADASRIFQVGPRGLAALER